MKLLFALVAFLCFLQFAEAGRVCRSVPQYKYVDSTVCKPTRVAPFTKTLVVKKPYSVYVPHVVTKTKSVYKTVCYNKKYLQSYRKPVRAYRSERYSYQEKYREFYSMRESYRATERATRTVKYLRSYTKLVNRRYKARVYYWYYYYSMQSYTAVNGCTKRVAVPYYVNVRTPYKTTCSRRSFKMVKKAFRGWKRVRYSKRVWTGRYEHNPSSPNCVKRIYKTVYDYKRVPTVVYKMVKVPTTRRSPCVKYRNVRTRKYRYVKRAYNCRKQRRVRRRLRRSKYVWRTKKVRVSYKKWATRRVSYSRYVMKYRSVRKYFYNYRSKTTVRRVPYFKYVSAKRWAYKAAHKRVRVNVRYQVVTKRRVVRYRLTSKTVPVRHVQKVCRTVQKKVFVGHKRFCN